MRAYLHMLGHHGEPAHARLPPRGGDERVHGDRAPAHLDLVVVIGVPRGACARAAATTWRPLRSSFSKVLTSQSSKSLRLARCKNSSFLLLGGGVRKKEKAPDGAPGACRCQLKVLTYFGLAVAAPWPHAASLLRQRALHGHGSGSGAGAPATSGGLPLPWMALRCGSASDQPGEGLYKVRRGDLFYSDWCEARETAQGTQLPAAKTSTGSLFAKKHDMRGQSVRTHADPIQAGWLTTRLTRR